MHRMLLASALAMVICSLCATAAQAATSFEKVVTDKSLSGVTIDANGDLFWVLDFDVIMRRPAGSSVTQKLFDAPRNMQIQQIWARGGRVVFRMADGRRRARTRRSSVFSINSDGTAPRTLASGRWSRRGCGTTAHLHQVTDSADAVYSRERRSCRRRGKDSWQVLLGHPDGTAQSVLSGSAKKQRRWRMFDARRAPLVRVAGGRALVVGLYEAYLRDLTSGAVTRRFSRIGRWISGGSLAVDGSVLLGYAGFEASPQIEVTHHGAGGDSSTTISPATDCWPGADYRGTEVVAIVSCYSGRSVTQSVTLRSVTGRLLANLYESTELPYTWAMDFSPTTLAMVVTSRSFRTWSLVVAPIPPAPTVAPTAIPQTSPTPVPAPEPAPVPPSEPTEPTKPGKGPGKNR